MTSEAGDAPHAEARFAGAMYLIVVLAGLFALAYAPGRIFAGETDAEVVQSVFANEGLLRASIAAELTCYVGFIALPLALHKLLAKSGAFAAALMAATALVSVPFGFANVTHLLEILRAVDGGASEAAQTAIATALDRYRAGLFVQSIPWGLWLIPLGYLTIRSGFLPRLLGALLILAGLGYVIEFLGRLLFADAYGATILSEVLEKLGFSEVLFCLWLLIFGARRTLLPQRRKT